jgi:hypothetical protein
MINEGMSSVIPPLIYEKKDQSDVSFLSEDIMIDKLCSI